MKSALERFRDLWFIEILKLARRRIFWAILAAYAVVGAVQTGVRLSATADSRGVEEVLLIQWPIVATGFYALSLILVPLLLIQVTAGEFEQRTARQSVASGLSRIEFLLAKLMSGATTACLFWLVGVSVGGGVVGVLAESGGGLPTARLEDVMLVGRLLVAEFCLASIGLFAGVLFRRTGTAIMWLAVYAVAFERAIGDVLASVDGQLMADLLPLAALRSIVFGVGAGTGPTGEEFGVPVLVSVVAALVYTAAFSVASLVLMERRDL